jgi:hypothetical protein
MNESVDLRNELGDGWDDDQENLNASQGHIAVGGPSIRETFGWDVDYLESARHPNTFAVSKKLPTAVHDYAVQGYVVYKTGVWGIDHRFPRFTAHEPVPLRLQLGQRRASVPDALQMTPIEVREAFDRYRAAWQVESAALSSPTEIVLLPGYQMIIGLGRPAVPLIIEALRSRIDYWFWALTAIVGKDHSEGAQTVQEAAERWIAWYDRLVGDD